MKNIVKRATLLAQSSFITLLELGTELLETPASNSTSIALRNEETEKEHILEALRQTGNNKSKAAQLLNIDRKTLYNKLKLYVFSVGKTIARQLRGSEAFVFFAATAGTEFEVFQHTLQQEEDMVKIYIADSLGSIIAEKTADCMEVALAEYIREKNWKHTNRYSPGYCGWHVSEQQKLFPLFPIAAPCGIRLTH